MRLDLTLPGFGGGSRRQPAKGRIINQTKPDPAKEAEDVFKEAVNPNTANRAMYDQHTKSGARRTQERVMTGASASVDDPTTGETIQRYGGGGGNGTTGGGGGGQKWSWQNTIRALKRLTGG